MKRRTLLTGTVAAGLTVAVGTAGQLDPMLLAAGTSAEPWTTGRAAAALDAASSSYTDSRYAAASELLSPLLAALHATHQTATGTARTTLAEMLARAYALGSSLATKYGDDAVALTLADRGLTAARATGHRITIAASTHVLAITMRRDGHHKGALHLLSTAADQLGADRGQPGLEVIGAYGSLLCTAAYTAAQAGDRAAADTYLREAADAATRINGTARHGMLPFNSATVDVYGIGAYTALGETGTALTHAAAVVPAQLPTTERRGRFLVDAARAWHRHGRPDRAAHALLAAERHAPEEINRPSVRELVTTLVYAPTPTPSELRALASRIGAR
ncbi:hypothetical protein GCM10010172_30350 [Paractinoplanes ferrugineus]|uniref:Uncharacterized protein n=1 Tax=Paractinoplanes ferrugineus TaxID=113564 RepID=A0A919J5B3_9ACTN|nr:hypothetical protein [Actinoplanes ferrugineus]GIE14273.1 hypothetical protein Afe05nite_61130 [Actinoplanes ferrugineus]